MFNARLPHHMQNTGTGKCQPLTQRLEAIFIQLGQVLQVLAGGCCRECVADPEEQLHSWNRNLHWGDPELHALGSI